jgi:thymidylate synthase (FAD)
MKLFIWDDIGFVERMAYTENGDLLVVNAARCSFDKEHTDFKEKGDTRLINYLAREKHVLPFRHPQLTLRMHMPIFVLRQMGKHQTGFSWSEVSRRYISGEPEVYRPENLRKYAEDKKQGSSDQVLTEHLEENSFWILDAATNKSVVAYNALMRAGVAPEQARMVLPQSMYTTVVVTGSLLGWHHLYTQRTEQHTQLETQYFARIVGQICEETFPISWNALTTHTS